jgi:hypothetical protein
VATAGSEGAPSLIRDVDMRRERGLAELGRNGLRRLPVDVSDDDVRAGLDQPSRGRRSDATRPSRDHRHASVEVQEVDE